MTAVINFLTNTTENRGNRMNKPGRTHHIRNRIITVILILAAAFCFGFVQWNSRIHYYSDEYTTGNTSTNLLNGGLFAESGDTIYFANPYDQNSLYSMVRSSPMLRSFTMTIPATSMQQADISFIQDVMTRRALIHRHFFPSALPAYTGSTATVRA